MQPPKLLLGGLGSLIGLLGWAIVGVPVTPIHLGTATANTIFPVSQAPKPLPKPLEHKTLENLRTRLGLRPDSLPTLQITKAQPTTWRDCLPNAQGEIPLNQPCEAVSRSGWRVNIAALGQTWVYYVTEDGFVTLDAPASISQQARSQLAQRLNLQPADLRIAAAELVATIQPCPPKIYCLPAPILSWRVLVNGQLLHVDWHGQEFSRGLMFRDSSAGLPVDVKNQIVLDVVDRQGLMAANLAVESIKATVWNWCRGHADSIGGPTPPEMGACPDVNQAGWQVIVRSGPLRYVYYPLKLAGASAPPPDGMQSVPTEAIALVRNLAAQQANTTPQQIRIHRVDPGYFDRCLSLNNDSLHCRQGIQAGWSVMALGDKFLPNGAAPAWVYHTALLGDRAKFARAGSWLPVPSAPPPR